MSLIEFIIAVYVLVDDSLRILFAGKTPWRQRGPQPALSDSEVLAMELIGEFLGYDTDEGIFDYFYWHWLDLFPALTRTNRTGFVRQAARLMWVKARLWRWLLLQLPYDPQVSIVDSFPLYVCQFARAKRCRRFFEEAAFGHDELLRQTFYGFRWHLRVSWPGVITEVALAPANLSDKRMAPEVLAGATGWALGDRNYWSPDLQEELRAQGIELLAPPKRRSPDRQGSWSRWLTQKRRRIETVIGQLVGRYHAKRTWARDLWHLLTRIYRKVLSHTVAVFLNLQRGGEPLQFDKLLAH
jgi:hypothetical protein